MFRMFIYIRFYLYGFISFFVIEKYIIENNEFTFIAVQGGIYMLMSCIAGKVLVAVYKELSRGNDAS